MFTILNAGIIIYYSLICSFQVNKHLKVWLRDMRLYVVAVKFELFENCFDANGGNALSNCQFWSGMDQSKAQLKLEPTPCGGILFWLFKCVHSSGPT